jgi:hypothetical protein
LDGADKLPAVRRNTKYHEQNSIIYPMHAIMSSRKQKLSSGKKNIENQAGYRREFFPLTPFTPRPDLQRTLTRRRVKN